MTVSDILASIFLEKDSHAEYFLSAEGVTRLDVLNFIAHHVSKTLQGESPGESTKTSKEQRKKKTNPLELFTTNLIKFAAQGKLDPLIGRKTEMERTMQVLCRRRKNNPVYIGDLLTLKASLNMVGSTSMEIGVHVEAENLLTGKRRHTNTCYLTFVAIDAVIDVPWTRKAFADKPDDFFCQPEDIAQVCFDVAHQPRSAWTADIVIRPFGETW